MVHYILTRFNIRIFPSDKHNNPTHNEGWLKTRFEVFERYCFPSIESQKFKDFTWVVLFDEETPKSFLERFRNLKKRIPGLRILLVKKFVGYYFIQVFQNFILDDLRQKGKEDETVVTTYLDNDDALTNDYLKRVNKIAQNLQEQTFITFHYGVQYIEELNLPTLIPYPNNHFLSYVERIRNGRIDTVYCLGSHCLLYKKAARRKYHIKSINTPEAPAWMEVVHRQNVANDIIMRQRIRYIDDPTLIQRCFSIDIETTHEAKKIFYTRYTLRYVRVFIWHIGLNFKKVYWRLERIYNKWKQRRNYSA